jgi:hypothetical protein
MSIELICALVVASMAARAHNPFDGALAKVALVKRVFRNNFSIRVK